MRKIVSTLIAFMLPLFAAAQSFTTLTFKEAQQRAAVQEKIILVDVTAARMMNEQKSEIEKQISQIEGVEEFIKEHAIAVRMDMGTSEGKDFAPLLQMNMYPTYAFMMPNGDLLGVVNPFAVSKNPALFMERANEYLKKAIEKRSNTQQIIFAELSFEEALKQAKRENKLVFIDAYTDNCQPCIMMERNVFTLDEVAQFYNTNFINISLNLGTLHTNLAERYNTYAYPTYLFIDGNGELKYRGEGYMEEDKFIELGKSAQKTRGIQFTQGSWKEILELAKKEDKPIFVDCYAVWCGPCKVMDAEVFTQPQVGDYFNSNFINVKIDMEKGEGVELKNYYDVGAYPTFLYLDSDGKELNRLVGSMSVQKFLGESQKGMSSRGLSALAKRYEAGERSQELIFDYLKALEGGYMQKEATKVANQYLASKEPSALEERENWALFMRYLTDANSDAFKYVHSNKSQFYTLYGEQLVDRKIFDVWSASSKRFVVKEGESVEFDAKGYKNFLKRLKREKVKDASLITQNANMHNCEMTGDWSGFQKIAEAKIEALQGIENVPIHDLYMWGIKIEKGCDDKAVRAKASRWFEVMAPLIAERENRKREEAKKAGAVMAMSMINYEKEFARLLDALASHN